MTITIIINNSNNSNNDDDDHNKHIITMIKLIERHPCE